MDSLYEHNRRPEPNTNDNIKESPPSWTERVASVSFLLFMGMFGVLRSGAYVIAPRMYPRAGGGGINLLHRETDGKQRRVAAVDFHPVRRKEDKITTWTVHAHSCRYPRKHLTIFDTGISADKAPPKKMATGLFIFGDEENTSVSSNDLDAYSMQQVLRPSPF